MPKKLTPIENAFLYVRRFKKKIDEVNSSEIDSYAMLKDRIYRRCPLSPDCENCPHEGTTSCILFDAPTPEPEYDSIVLGPCTGYDSDNRMREGEMVTISAKGDGSFILMSGMSGSGKSMSLRRIIDTLNVKKQRTIVLFDAKNQYRSSLKPNKYRHTIMRGETASFPAGHLPGEKMHSCKMKFYIPKYVKIMLRGVLPDDVKDYNLLSFPFRFYSASDLLQLIEDPGQRSLKVHFATIQKAIMKAEAKNPKYTLEDLEREIQGMTAEKKGSKKNISDTGKIKTIEENTMRMLLRKLESLEILGLADDNSPDDIFLKDLDDGIIPVIVYNYGGFTRANSTLLDGLVDSQLNYLYNHQATTKNPKPLWFILDEARHLLPPLKNPPSKDTIQNILTMGRSKRMNIILAIQNIKQIDKDVSNLDFNHYITFKPDATEIDSFWKGKLIGSPTAKWSIEKLRLMKFEINSLNECALIDKNGRMVTFWPLMSLSAHHD